MKKLLIFIFCLISTLNYSQVIEPTKTLPKNVTIETLEMLGDSIKIIKADDYNFDVLIINKKDTIKAAYLSFKYNLKEYITEGSKFEQQNKTVFYNGSFPFEAMRVNSDKLSFFWFRYTETFSSKTFTFMCTIEKLKELENQIKNFD
jgi:hypothetical protein